MQRIRCVPVQPPRNCTFTFPSADCHHFPPVNMAFGKTAIQSATLNTFTADKAVDGNYDTSIFGHSCTHTTVESNVGFLIILVCFRLLFSVCPRHNCCVCARGTCSWMLIIFCACMTCVCASVRACVLACGGCACVHASWVCAFGSVQALIARHIMWRCFNDKDKKERALCISDAGRLQANLRPNKPEI